MAASGPDALNPLTMRGQGKQLDQDSHGMPRPMALATLPEVRCRARCVRLILVELGSAGIEAYSAPDGTEQTFALVQLEQEGAAEFASRVARRIGMLERS